MKEWREKLIIMSITASISACSSSSKQYEFNSHSELPSSTVTRASNILGCFGDMLTAYRTNGSSVDPLRVAVVDVKDSTNVSSASYPDSEIPNNFSDMTLGVVSRIGGPIRVSHTPTTTELLDAARYKSTAGPNSPSFLGNFKPSHYRFSTIQLYGALSEYDRIIQNNKSSTSGALEVGGGSGESNFEGTSSKVTNVARMTMDFRVASANVGDVVNNSSSTNTIQVHQRGKDSSFGLSIDGNSIGYSTEKSVVDARHKAIRLLVEWGVVEALGRYAYVPYWKCFPNARNSANISFKDIASSGGLHDFTKKTVRAAAIRKDQGENPDLIDMRDKLLINSVMSDFVNAEYVDEGVRKLVRRPENNAPLIQRKMIKGKAVESKSTIDGKATLRQNLLSYYRVENRYSEMSDSVLLETLYKRFVEAKIVNEKDTMMSTNTYIALWLNVPVKEGARWRR